MADIIIPAVGESVTSGVIQKWTIADGAFANKDDIVLELETDKVTAELRAETSGTVRHLAKGGDRVAGGPVVGKIKEGRGAPARAPAARAAAEPNPPAPPVSATATAVMPPPSTPTRTPEPAH